MVYPYKCKECDIQFEVEKPMQDASLKEYCPHCRQDAKREYTPLGFTFGWRLTQASRIKGNKDTIEKAI